jgi:hypothetical protein
MPAVHVVVDWDQSPEDPVTTAVVGAATRMEVHETGEQCCPALIMSAVFGCHKFARADAPLASVWGLDEAPFCVANCVTGIPTD